ncbi:MAG: hypothetical protein ACU0DK_16560 [Pseudooceanicola sp.]
MQKKQKRWMKSVIEAAKADCPTLPYQRGYIRPQGSGDRVAALRKAA